MSSKKKSWELDQLTKSEFFHEKLHEWELLDVAEHIENVQGEKLDWALKTLGITTNAWDKIIHRGIKPVKVFAHPRILTTIRHATGYYRMLAMTALKKGGEIISRRYNRDNAQTTGETTNVL